jgi:peptidyl-prolyl cis-trans isomerase SurA
VTGQLLALTMLAALLGGCAAPRWMPFMGKSKGSDPNTARMAPPPGHAQSPAPARAPIALSADSVADRIVAVVNNDAITLGELQETIAGYRQENRGAVSVTDAELIQQFLTRIIENRLQLQEAEREKITVEDAEVDEELTERMKRFGAKSKDDLEAMVKAQGLTMEAVKKKVRDAVRVSKIIRRKVTLRVSVTEDEIDRYLTANREKLETGLSYHARHILITPTGASDAAWEAARIRADMIRAQILEGADFAELARQHSQDASAKDGGDLGTLKRGELASEVETHILSLRAGETSRPYRSALGHHIFRLESKEALEGEALQRARQQVREILFRQKYEARLEAWLKEIKQRAIIEVRM